MKKLSAVIPGGVTTLLLALLIIGIAGAVWASSSNGKKHLSRSPITVIATSTAPTASAATTTDHYAPPAQTKKFGCVAIAGMPDGACSPGAVFADVTVDEICQSGYSKSVRDVPDKEKKQVYLEYGVLSHATGEYEVDHLISLELGGSNDIANLWPEAANPKPGFHEKDKVENYLHEQICSGAMSLADAQRFIATGWLDVYQQYLVR